MDCTQEAGESARVWERVDVPAGQQPLEALTWYDLVREVKQRQATLLIDEREPGTGPTHSTRRIVVRRGDGTVWEAHYGARPHDRIAYCWPDYDATPLLSVTTDELRRLVRLRDEISFHLGIARQAGAAS
ncbi:MAG: hypothetical protein AB7U23_10015 [Dehalococcoidia bacterium]